MDINAFREAPLSNEIVAKLVEAVEAICALKSAYNASDYKSLIDKSCLIDQIRYVNAFSNTDYSYDLIVNALYTTHGLNAIKTQVMNIDKGKPFLRKRFAENSILFASDMIKLNEAFNNNLDLCDGKIETLAPIQSIHKEIGEILSDLHDPSSEYPLILETAIALYRLISIDDSYTVSVFLIDLLIQILFKLDFSFTIGKQLIIHKKIDETSAELGIKSVLEIFNDTAKDSLDLIHTLSSKAEQIKIDISKKLPKIHSEKLFYAITQDLSVRNESFINSMGISTKTAILYLKMLENNGFLKSYKIGKEKIYINEDFLSCIKDDLDD